MSFIPDSERIILFDVPTRAGPKLSLDDMLALRDAGIGTMLANGSNWDQFEPKIGQYNWKYIDAILERGQRVGMRTLLPIWEKQSSIYPDEWYSKVGSGSHGSESGQREYLFSPWNKDAQAHALEVLKLVKNYAESSTCQVISNITRCGESVMPQDPRFYDAAAIASWKRTGEPDVHPNMTTKGGQEWLRKSYTQLIASQQAILANNPWHEAWFMLTWRSQADHPPG